MTISLDKQQQEILQVERQFPKLERLSNEDVKEISAAFQLPAAETLAQIMSGVRMLGSTYVLAGSAFGFTDAASIPAAELLHQPLRVPVKLHIGTAGTKDIGLFLRSRAFCELTGSTEHDPQLFKPLQFSFHGIEPQSVVGHRHEMVSKILIPNSEYIHEGRTVGYGFYDPNNELAAIVPVTSDRVDERMSIPTIPHLYRVFVRDRSMSKEAELLRYAEEFTSEATSVHNQLQLPQEKMPTSDLLFDAGPSFAAYSMAYKGSHGEQHYHYFFGTMRLEDLNQDERSRRRLFRHEYIHNVDHVLGDGQNYFSELAQDRIVEIISTYLYNGAAIRVPMDAESDASIEWPDNGERVSSMITEARVFNCPMMGHATSNIRELLTSALNVYCDPLRDEALSQLPKERQTDVRKMYTELFHLVQKRIQERTGIAA